MRKLIVIVAATVAVGGTASAKHERNDQSCSDCHSMHGSISHSQSGDYGAPYPILTSGNDGMLLQGGVNATCLVCHDGTGDTAFSDVFGADDRSTGSIDGKRSAGALNGAVSGKDDGGSYADHMGHTLGSLARPPGFNNTGAPWPAGGEGLTCAKCHAVHGGAPDAFRHLGGVNDMGWEGLKYTSGNPFLSAYPRKNPLGTFDASYDVTVLPGSASASHAARIVYGKGQNGMNRYCGVCHGNFHGSANTGAGANFRRHPTTGEQREASWFAAAAQVGSNAQGGVVRPLWTGDGKFEVGCLTCHKAHGSKRAFGLVWPQNAAIDPATTNFEDGDGTAVETLCATCHVQARTTAAAAGGWAPADAFDAGVH